MNENKLLSKGISSEINEHHLYFIRHYLIGEQFPPYHCSEYFICDENLLSEEFWQQLFKLTDYPDQPLYDKNNFLKVDMKNIFE